MAFVRRSTDKDATWARAWTADDLADLVDISALGGSESPRHGDIAFVTATGQYYLWMDDDTWTALSTNSSGVYTPTLTDVANLDSSTAYECQFLKVGNIVTVSGKVDINPTLTATLTQLGISLPVASNFGASEDCAGVAFASGIAGQGAAILADTANDRAQLEYISSDITDQPMYFTFTYQVI
jgi:hypothetical protein